PSKTVTFPRRIYQIVGSRDLPVSSKAENGSCQDRSKIRCRVSRCDSGQPEEIVHQIERGDQQHALPQNGYQRCLKGLSRSLQIIAAQVKEPKKEADQNQPKEEASLQGVSSSLLFSCAFSLLYLAGVVPYCALKSRMNCTVS
ncbi:MAG: hypothetical protein IIY46_07655, partial [Lachnospiraceae bacterium]|nr:hypothetical protein [Lachnospiraceae bacterium]